jgi:hypothetical protein
LMTSVKYAILSKRSIAPNKNPNEWDRAQMRGEWVWITMISFQELVSIHKCVAVSPV